MSTPDDEKKIYYTLMGLKEDNFNDLPMAKMLPISDEKLKAHIKQGCTGQGGWIGVIDGEDNEIVGTTGIFAVQPWWTEEWGLSQYWMYVDEDYRAGTGYGRDLFQFAKWLREDRSKVAGYTVPLETSVLSNKRLKEKMRLWGRSARQVGGLFLSID
jgi:hypothetical protein